MHTTTVGSSSSGGGDGGCNHLFFLQTSAACHRCSFISLPNVGATLIVTALVFLSISFFSVFAKCYAFAPSIPLARSGQTSQRNRLHAKWLLPFVRVSFLALELRTKCINSWRNAWNERLERQTKRRTKKAGRKIYGFSEFHLNDCKSNIMWTKFLWTRISHSVWIARKALLLEIATKKVLFWIYGGSMAAWLVVRAELVWMSVFLAL